MEQNILSPPTLREMAVYTGLHPGYFHRIFKETMGESPRAYLETKRLAEAARLLALGTLKVEDVAEQCGFTDLYYFSKRFKRKYQCPPGEFKRRGRRP